MAVNTKAIKTRITSVKNTKKITKAMEMVSAAKMRKAVDAAVTTRRYAHLAKELFNHLARIDEPNYPLLEKRPVGNVLMILISSNRGLCGSFNANVIKKAAHILEDKQNVATHRNALEDDIAPQEQVTIDVLGIGKKSAAFAKRNNLNLIGVYDDIGEKPSFEAILPISDQIIRSYLEKQYDKVVLVYTHFESSLVQTTKVRQLLPLSEVDLDKMLHELGDDENVTATDFEIESYLFEPDVETIVNQVIPRLVEVQLYQGMLESAASEHSARMLAMKSASDAAGDMIDALNTEFNKARQAAITQEIAEIAGGAAALE